MRPSRPVPAVGDAVLVRYLASTEPGRLVAVEQARVLVETAQGTEWFELSRVTGRFVRAGEAYTPRLSWPAPQE
jgi:hypothetical protein